MHTIVSCSFDYGSEPNLNSKEISSSDFRILNALTFGGMDIGFEANSSTVNQLDLSSLRC